MTYKWFERFYFTHAAINTMIMLYLMIMVPDSQYYFMSWLLLTILLALGEAKLTFILFSDTTKQEKFTDQLYTKSTFTKIEKGIFQCPDCMNWSEFCGIEGKVGLFCKHCGYSDIQQGNGD